MNGVLFILGPLVAVAVFVYLLRKRRLRGRELGMRTAMVWAGTPTGPTLPGVEWAFPGRGTAGPEDPRRTATTVLDNHSPAKLPPGVVRSDASGEDD